VRISSIVIGIAALAFSGCGPTIAGRGDYEIRGSIIDAETGAPISRSNVYVHVFNDLIKEQASPGLAVESTFTVRMLVPQVRLRIYDASSRYQLYETEFDVPESGLDHVARLMPTHYVLVKGRLMFLEGDTWIPLSPQVARRFGKWPGLGFRLDGDREGSWSVRHDSDASFEVRVPRERLLVSLINTGLEPVTDVVDLTGVTADLVERDVQLVPRKQ